MEKTNPNVNMTMGGILATLQITGKRMAVVLKALQKESGQSQRVCAQTMFQTLNSGFRQECNAHLFDILFAANGNILGVYKTASETDDEKTLVSLADELTMGDAVTLLPIVASSLYKHLTPAIGQKAAKEFVLSALSVAGETLDEVADLGSDFKEEEV